MNPEKQRIAIAKACGYKNVRLAIDYYDCPICVADMGSGVGIVPDFPNDLNAMQEACALLRPRDKELFRIKLQDICATDGGSDRPKSYASDAELIHATAAQRAEAFLRTVGKWEEPAV